MPTQVRSIRTLTAFTLVALLGASAEHAAATVITSGMYTACSQGEACGMPFSFVDIRATGTRVIGGAGNPPFTGVSALEVQLVLPDAFDFYGVPYTTIEIGGAGYLQFANPSLSNGYNHTIPSFGFDRSIHVLTTAWGSAVGSAGVYHEYFANGAGGFTDPTLVIQWYGSTVLSQTSPVFSAEALLNLRTNQILVQVSLVSGSGNPHEGFVMGLQNNSSAPSESLLWLSRGPFSPATWAQTGVFNSSVLYTPPQVAEPSASLLLLPGLAIVAFGRRTGLRRRR